MKKLIFVLFAFVSVMAFAQSESDFKVSVWNGKVIIYSYTGSGGNVVIPARIQGLPVTEIDRYAFSDRSDLISISIPSSVTDISSFAFVGCTGLTNISVDPRNTSYSSRGGVLFNKAEDTLIKYPAGKKEKHYAIPTSVTSIGWQAFSDCTGLTSEQSGFKILTLGGADGGITIIGYTGTAATVVIPAGITHIGSGAFKDRTGLTSISIPASVTSIGDWAFSGCTSLTSISIPASVTGIGAWAFENCTGLTDISVDPHNTAYSSRDGVLFTKAGDALIKYPAGKKEKHYAIPVGVIEIGQGAFESCTSLTSVRIPVGVTSIGNVAFWRCTRLTSINIPASVTSMDHGALASFTTIRIGANVQVVTSDVADFNNDYSRNGSKAGVYTFRNGAWSYAAR